MAKEIVVNVGQRETRIAVMEDGKLAELLIERDERVVGGLYKGRVMNVLSGMDAAFVDIGLDRNAFLQVGDVLPQENPSSAGRSEAREDTNDDRGEDSGDESGEPASAGRAMTKGRTGYRRADLKRQRIADILKVGQEILVQVIKGPRGTKGARASTRISLPGRFLVLMPDSGGVGVSRKIEDGQERTRLKRIGSELVSPGFGIIIRTEAEDKTEADLRADWEFLFALWDKISTTARTVHAPALIHQDLTLIYKTIRDVFGSDVQRLILDDPCEYERAYDLLGQVAPRLRGRLHLYTGSAPIFDHYSVETEVDKTLKRKVWLRSGGYLIFDETEALTVIDVNTGKFTGGSSSSNSLNDTIVKTNIDASSEIARQLRLRDIGGIIVIDFIDMANPRDRQQVIKVLESALKADRARTKISGISALGLVEMTRKRTAETITDFLTEPCAYCGGRGKVPSPETVSLMVERELRRAAVADKKPQNALLIRCHPSVAEFVIGPEGDNVDRLERELQRAIFVRADGTAPIEKIDVSSAELPQLEKQYSAGKKSQVIEVEISRSDCQPEQGAVAWNGGYLLVFEGGKQYVGRKTRVRLTDVRRSWAAASVISN